MSTFYGKNRSTRQSKKKKNLWILNTDISLPTVKQMIFDNLTTLNGYLWRFIQLFFLKKSSYQEKHLNWSY